MRSFHRQIVVFGVAGSAVLGACKDSTAPAASPGSVDIDATDSLGKRPFGVAVNAAGVVLVGRQDGNNVVRGSLSNFVFTTGIPAGNDPGTLAMSPDGTKALISNFNDGAVGVIDVASNTQTNTVDVATSPYQVGFLPNGTKFYVGTGGSGVKVFNASTLAAGPTIAAGTSLNGMAFNKSRSIRPPMRSSAH
jgi:YVTN family beta-propeller protein